MTLSYRLSIVGFVVAAMAGVGKPTRAQQPTFQQSAAEASRAKVDLCDPSKPGAEPQWGLPAQLDSAQAREFAAKIDRVDEARKALDARSDAMKANRKSLDSANLKELFWSRIRGQGLKDRDLPLVWHEIVAEQSAVEDFLQSIASGIFNMAVAERIDSVKFNLIGGSMKQGDVRFINGLDVVVQRESRGLAKMEERLSGFYRRFNAEFPDHPIVYQQPETRANLTRPATDEEQAAFAKTVPALDGETIRKAAEQATGVRVRRDAFGALRELYLKIVAAGEIKDKTRLDSMWAGVLKIREPSVPSSDDLDALRSLLVRGGRATYGDVRKALDSRTMLDRAAKQTEEAHALMDKLRDAMRNMGNAKVTRAITPETFTAGTATVLDRDAPLVVGGFGGDWDHQLDQRAQEIFEYLRTMDLGREMWRPKNYERLVPKTMPVLWRHQLRARMETIAKREAQRANTHYLFVRPNLPETLSYDLFTLDDELNVRLKATR